MSTSSPLPPTQPRGSALGRVLKVLLLLVLLLVIAFLGLGLFVLDGKYEISREITIQARPAEIHKFVGDLREWPKWLPFSKPEHDPSVKTTVVQPTGVGANQSWTSNNGNGELTFTVCDEAKGVEYQMVFDKKWKSQGTLSYAPSGEGTKLTWRMSGQNDDFAGKWMAALMPYMVGPMFEDGLADLKHLAEEKK